MLLIQITVKYWCKGTCFLTNYQIILILFSKKRQLINPLHLLLDNYRKRGD